MKDFMGECRVLFSYPKHIIILLARLVVAYGFAVPALVKIRDIDGTISWFKGLSIPLPTLSTYLVTGIEMVGIVLLIFGLFTRYISLLLALIMLGAMAFVHVASGFSVANNGIEIPFYYFIFLIIFATFGAGKFSLDYFIFKGKQ